MPSGSTCLYLSYRLKFNGDTYSGMVDLIAGFLLKIWSISFGSTISIWYMSVSSLLHTSMSSQSLFVELVTNDDIVVSFLSSICAFTGVEVTGADFAPFLSFATFVPALRAFALFCVALSFSLFLSLDFVS
jgi:hypothetical protein